MPEISANSPISNSGGSGLTSQEAQLRLKQFGPNAVKEEKPHPVKRLLLRFWAPVPWLLEATIVLQLFLGERLEAYVIGGLLVFNAALSSVQEGRTQRALALLRQKLQVVARVRRDGAWVSIPAEGVVPGDVIHMRQGGIVPADVRIDSGSLLVDQSALTGESAAASVDPGKSAFAGGLVRGGEATGEVISTGTNTFFGKTSELVRTARSANRQEHEITTVVENLFVVNAAMIVGMAGYASFSGMSLQDILPLLLTILLASSPVALPATFTLTAALGSIRLTGRGVLVTRLSALHDIASMTVLCSDKTGTLTRNEVAVRTLWTMSNFSQDELLSAAAFASDPAGQDPVDGAVVQAATQHGWKADEAARIAFKSFDPATKRAEAEYRHGNEARHYMKGAPAVVAKLAGVEDAQWLPHAQEIAAQGERALAVADGDGRQWRLLGLIGLEDAVRKDSRAVVSTIKDAGVRVVMVTGDNALTAMNVAEQVGIPPHLFPAERLGGHFHGEALDEDIFSGVFPEDKFKLVRAFQRRGNVVGMSGDGVNDAPALRQAEVGVAVANATDVAKAAAAIVLTQPGLGGVVPALQESRGVFQRMITYTLNMLTKKIEIMFLLVAGFLLTGHKPLTPLLMVIIVFLNDFLTMALSTDRMSISHRPNRWNTRAIVTAASALAVGLFAFSFGVFAFGHYVLHFDTPHLQTLTFITIVFSTQANVYLLRERGHFWDSRPSLPLIVSSVLGIAVAVMLARTGWIIAPLQPDLLARVAIGTIVYGIGLDWLKVWLFRGLRLR